MTKESNFHIDSVFSALGSKGKYQICQFILASLGVLPAAFQLLDNVFIGGDVPHTCAAPHNQSVLFEDLQNEDNTTAMYKECSIDVIANGSSIKSTACLYGIDYELPISRSVKSQFDLVCSKEALYSLTQTLVFVGQGMGALIGTVLSDRLGRKPVVALSNLGLLAVGLIIAYAPNYIVFAIFKFLVGAFQQSLYVSMTIFLVELLPTEHRRLAATIGGISWGIGSVSLTGIAFLFRNTSWRHLQTALTLFSLIGFVQLWGMDESLRWLTANGKKEKTLACIKRAARMNNKNFEEVLKAGYSDRQTSLNMELEVDPAIVAKDAKDETMDACEFGSDKQNGKEEENGHSHSHSTTLIKVKKMSFLDLLKIRRLFFNALVMWLAWFTCSLSYFTLYLTASALSGDKYLNYLFMCAMDIPASLSFYFAYDRIGRKTTTIILFAVLGTCLFAVGLFKHFSSHEGDIFDHLTLVVSLFAMIGASGSFFSLFFYLPELFPTNLRNQATGVASFVARIGAMLAPFTGVLADIAIWAPGLLMGACAVVVVLTMLTLPETKGRELPQTLEDLEQWYSRGSKCEIKDTLKEENGNNEKMYALLPKASVV